MGIKTVNNGDIWCTRLIRRNNRGTKYFLGFFEIVFLNPLYFLNSSFRFIV